MIDSALTLGQLGGTADAAGAYMDLPESIPPIVPEVYLDAYLQLYRGLTNSGRYPTTVYAAVHTGKNKLALQYHFFYYVGRVHEGDWELVQLEFNTSDVLRILRENISPSRIIYSQHGKGIDLNWQEAPTVLGHPVVYPALGSHANYFAPGAYSSETGENLGQNIVVDVLIDWTSVDGSAVVPLGLERQLDNADSYGEPRVMRFATDPWLSYSGRWGEITQPPYRSGPLGPAFQDSWLDPFEWWR